jgi:N-acylneuraminate cytidylyltransferase
LKLPFVQGIQDKVPALTRLLEERGVDPRRTIYLGNDTNDLACFPLVGWAAAVVDALPEVRRAADYILTKPGGQGAVRELCDLILSRIEVTK